MAYFMDLHLYKHKKAILEMKEASNRKKQEKKSYENSKIKRKTYAPKLSWVIDSNTNYILNIAIDLNIKWVEAKKPKEIQSLNKLSPCQI